MSIVDIQTKKIIEIYVQQAILTYQLAELDFVADGVNAKILGKIAREFTEKIVNTIEEVN